MLTPTLRSWRLIQVGAARVPQADSLTEISAEFREAVMPLHGGGRHNFYGCSRAPLDHIVVSHSGSYTGPCPECPENALIGTEGISEFEMLKRYGGLSNVPMLFVSPLINCEPHQWLPVFDCGCCDERVSFAGCWQSDPRTAWPDCGDCEDDECWRQCLGSMMRPCVQYAWAPGRITRMPSTELGIRHYRTDLQDISFELELSEPLREVTWERWRYGRPPVAAENATAFHAREVELASLESRELWSVSIPCSAPGCCEKMKWWPRDIRRESRTPIGRFDPNLWEYTHARVFQEPGVQRVYVGGNAEPEVMLLCTHDAIVSVRNDVRIGDTYSFPAAPSRSFVYTNSYTGEAWYRTGSKLSPLPTAIDRLRLEPGVNTVTFAAGTGVIAWIERYY